MFDLAKIAQANLSITTLEQMPLSATTQATLDRLTPPLNATLIKNFVSDLNLGVTKGVLNTSGYNLLLEDANWLMSH